MLKRLKEEVYEANLMLPKHNLITFTWGNVSGIDRERGLIVIKPSGIKYSEMKASDMVVVDFNDNIIEGELNPSSDLPTHLELYREFENINGIVHTHSKWATIWAQSGMSIPALGTTHSDYFYGDIPCTRPLMDSEIKGEYELNTGTVIIEEFSDKDQSKIPAVLVCNHGPFTWGENPSEAVQNAVVLEEIAMMAWHNYTMSIMTGSDLQPICQLLQDKHYLRKHGVNAYYGQSSKPY